MKSMIPRDASPSKDHYLREMFELKQEKGYVRVTDVARRLEVKKSAVSQIISKLEEEGFIDRTDHPFINLTPRGVAAARLTISRFNILNDFMIEVLGIPQEVAFEDACKLEHFVSDETTDRLVDMIRFFQQDNPEVKNLLKKFQKFHRTCEGEDSCPVCEYNCDVHHHH